MKRLFCCVILLTLILSLAACGNQSSTPGVDVDLSKLSSTMVYSEVNNMTTKPKDYIGKTVKMKGKFSVYEDKATGKNYYAVVFEDTAACCSNALEFVLAGNYKYPDDYPKLGKNITVTGVFQTYKEGETQYCHLIDATLEK